MGNGDVTNHAVEHQLTNHRIDWGCWMLNLQYKLFSTTDSSEKAGTPSYNKHLLKGLSYGIFKAFCPRTNDL